MTVGLPGERREVLRVQRREPGVGGVRADPVLVVVGEAGLPGRDADGRVTSQEKSRTATLLVLRVVDVDGDRRVGGQARRGEVAGPLPRLVGAGDPEPAAGAPGEPAQEVDVRAALHQRVLVVGVRRGVPPAVVAGAACSRGRAEDLVRDVDVAQPGPLLDRLGQPHQHARVLAPHVDGRAGRPGGHVHLVGQHVAVEDAVLVAVVGRDDDGDVRVRRDAAVPDPGELAVLRGDTGAAARSRPAGRRSPRSPAWRSRRRSPGRRAPVEEHLVGRHVRSPLPPPGCR